MNFKNDVEKQISVYKGMYDNIKIVDTVNDKVVYEYSNEHNLFSYHQRQIENKSIDTIVTRAHEKKSVVMELKYESGKVLLIAAVPCEGNEDYIMEMKKDITNEPLVFDEGRGSVEPIGSFLKEVLDLSIKDTLTGVYNRRYINERLPIDIKKNVNKEAVTSVIMADIDYFKEINDSYGHVIGDKVLRDFSSIMNKCIRKDVDWIGRYGGEEFLIVLNNTEEERAREIVERIRRILEKHTFKYDDIEVKITCSFGIHTSIKEVCSIEEIIKKADENLYLAKRRGRNRIVSDKIVCIK